MSTINHEAWGIKDEKQILLSRKEFLNKAYNLGLVLGISTNIPPLLKPFTKSVWAADFKKTGLTYPIEAMYYEKIATSQDKVKCLLCPRMCTISQGRRGYCQVRSGTVAISR